jgi:DNA-damage-inducible protein D
MTNDTKTPPTSGLTSVRNSRKTGNIDQLIEEFEKVSHIDEQEEVEFWYARDLQKLLAYADYDNFLKIVEKAKLACENSGQDSANHFRDVTEMVPIGSGAVREIANIRMDRYACYLTAQNGDSRKAPIAFAQTYFAIQARRQEIRDAEDAQYPSLSEAQKRIWLREEMKAHNTRLASAAKGAGVVRPLDYAVFTNYGYKGLYGGLDRDGIHQRKGLLPKQQILDHMGSTELAANLFRATQTEEKLRRDIIQGKEAANTTHYNVGKTVRDTIKQIGGEMPEDLPTAPDVNKVAKSLNQPDLSEKKKLK